jgi:hypothetical protein
MQDEMGLVQVGSWHLLGWLLAVGGAVKCVQFDFSPGN